MFNIAQSLAIFFLVSAAFSGVLLAIAYQFDEETFDKLGLSKMKTTPGLIKSAKLFGLSQRPVFQVIYLLSLIFVLFAYVAIVLLIIHLAIWIINSGNLIA
ncbi:MAG: hypothetical protein ABJH72_21635 [Reichenbachiella sp.]|uniref:hypothetical protein n=2 Tax=Reichenbachiella sp. TaxID=2184521 RepID=UPI0032650B2A